MHRILLLHVTLALFAPAAGAAAQTGDTTRTARIAYRTRDIVFVSAGRAEGLAVGDTLSCVNLGTVVARAVVTSIATHSAGARLLDAAADVREGHLATWRPRIALAAATPAPDTTPPAAAVRAPAEPRAPARAASNPSRRAAGGSAQLEHQSSAGGGASSAQSIGALSLRVPLSSALELRIRSTARYRGGPTRLPGTQPLSVVAYEMSARIGRPNAPWAATLGRFVPTEVMALGYIDGVQVSRRAGASGRLGVVAGFVPLADRLRPSAATTRAGLFWILTSGRALDARLAAAADWAGGARRRTQLAGQASWYPSGGVGFSVYADADLGATWDSTGARLTGANASASFVLPLGFRATIGAESRQAIRLWESWVPGDTTPLPGRITGFNASLGRTVAGVALTAAGGWLHRAGDPAGTLRGTVSAASRTLFVTVSGQHGDLFDYGAATGRWLLRTRGTGPSVSIGAVATVTRSRGGITLWRYAARPELAWPLGQRWYATAGADLGRYAGHPETWVHAGVSYRFR